MYGEMYMTSYKLPPLPYPQIPGNDYTIKDMIKMREDTVRIVLEAAARVAEKHFHSTTAKQIRDLTCMASTGEAV